jgi:hypothetical protein
MRLGAMYRRGLLSLLDLGSKEFSLQVGDFGFLKVSAPSEKK